MAESNDSGRRSGDSSPITAGDLFDVFKMLSDKIDAKHQNLRETVEDLYQRGNVRMDAHDREDRLVADRVIRIEEGRSAEHMTAVQNEARKLRETDLRVGLFSLFVSAVVSVAVFLMTKLWP